MLGSLLGLFRPAARWGLVAALLVGSVACQSPSAPTPPAGDASPAGSSVPAASPAAARGDYNVVLVSFDAMRARDTSLYGYGKETTPNLARFAQGAVVFENAVAPASWTLPSTMAIFTGLYPSVHGVINKLTPDEKGGTKMAELSASVGTLPQLLFKQGYILGGFTGGAGVTGKFGYSRDFDTYVDDLKFGSLDHSLPKALAWLEAHKDQKFFLFLHGYDCHGQFDPPEGYKRTYAEGYKGPLKGGKEEQGKFREEALQNKFKEGGTGEPTLDPKKFTPADAAFYQSEYDEKIHRADGKFGEFLAAMDRMGLTDKTIFVLLADHGEEFMEHGGLDHGPTLYQEMIHVPLIIKIPGFAPRRVEARISSLDALPTVLEYLGIQHPPVDGVSLLPLMEGKTMELPPVFSETDYRLFSHKRAVVVGDHKIIMSLDSGKVEAYDLKADPKELKPLAVQDVPWGPELKKTLDDWVEGLPRRVQDYSGGADKTIKIY